MTSLKKGFTLIELLIVIAILGVLIIIVVAALNPIEQLNRSRDTRYKADAGTITSAVERYFTANTKWPWVTIGGIENDDAYGFINVATLAPGPGICGTACTAAGAGVLITGDELRADFIQRDFLTTAETVDIMLVGKEQGTNKSVYTCFIPKAKSTKDKACTDGKVFTLNPTTGVRTPDTLLCPVATTDWAASGLYVCVPE